MTLTLKEVKFRDNVIHLAEFYEEHHHYSVPRSNKTLFQFCKNMKTIIRNRKEGVFCRRQMSDVQYKILRDIKFVEYTVKLEKSKKQHPITKAFRNLLVNVDDFKKQNGHTNFLHPDAKLNKKITHSDGSVEEKNLIGSLQGAFRMVRDGKLGIGRRMKLKEKGIDIDDNMMGGEQMEDTEEFIDSLNDDNPGAVSNMEDEDLQVDHEDEGVELFDPGQKDTAASEDNTSEDEVNKNSEVILSRTVSSNERREDEESLQQMDEYAPSGGDVHENVYIPEEEVNAEKENEEPGERKSKRLRTNDTKKPSKGSKKSKRTKQDPPSQTLQRRSNRRKNM